eukprot:1266603-Prorocentrum_lima.AAC.1
MTSSLVGSEMCIRDRFLPPLQENTMPLGMAVAPHHLGVERFIVDTGCAVSYTHLTLPTICSV